MFTIKNVRSLLAFVIVKSTYDLCYGSMMGRNAYKIDADEFHSALFVKFNEVYDGEESERLTNRILEAFTRNGCIRYDAFENKYALIVNFYGNIL